MDVQTKARNAHEKARLPQPGPQESQSTPEQVSLAEISIAGSSQGSLVLPEKLMLNRPEAGWVRDSPTSPHRKRASHLAVDS